MGHAKSSETYKWESRSVQHRVSKPSRFFNLLKLSQSSFGLGLNRRHLHAYWWYKEKSPKSLENHYWTRKVGCPTIVSLTIHFNLVQLCFWFSSIKFNIALIKLNLGRGLSSNNVIWGEVAEIIRKPLLSIRQILTWKGNGQTNIFLL